MAARSLPASDRGKEVMAQTEKAEREERETRWRQESPSKTISLLWEVSTPMLDCEQTFFIFPTLHSSIIVGDFYDEKDRKMSLRKKLFSLKSEIAVGMKSEYVEYGYATALMDIEIIG